VDHDSIPPTSNPSSLSTDTDQPQASTHKGRGAGLVRPAGHKPGCSASPSRPLNVPDHPALHQQPVGIQSAVSAFSLCGRGAHSYNQDGKLLPRSAFTQGNSR